MGLLGLFRKRKNAATSVLVCACESRFDELLAEDADVYKRYYTVTTALSLRGPEDVIMAVERGFDIVHLLCDFGSCGSIAGSSVTGDALIDKCCRSGVKLLWVASNNKPDAYIKGFSAGVRALNLVMTINRNGQKFSIFLDQLLSRMSRGDTMPIAWNALAPQIPGLQHSDAPELIFAAGLGSARFR